jgi:hypothetical protein
MGEGRLGRRRKTARRGVLNLRGVRALTKGLVGDAAGAHHHHSLSLSLSLSLAQLRADVERMN